MRVGYSGGMVDDAPVLGYAGTPVVGGVRVFWLTFVFAVGDLLSGALATLLYSLATLRPMLLGMAIAVAITVVAVGMYLPTLLLLRNFGGAASRFRWALVLGLVEGSLCTGVLVVSSPTGFAHVQLFGLLVVTVLVIWPVVCGVVTVFVPPVLARLRLF